MWRKRDGNNHGEAQQVVTAAESHLGGRAAAIPGGTGQRLDPWTLVNGLAHSDLAVLEQVRSGWAPSLRAAGMPRWPSRSWWPPARTTRRSRSSNARFWSPSNSTCSTTSCPIDVFIADASFRGDRLQTWLQVGDTPSRLNPAFMMSADSARFFDEGVGRCGAVISGRRTTYDVSDAWSDHGPMPPLPLFSSPITYPSSSPRAVRSTGSSLTALRTPSSELSRPPPARTWCSWGRAWCSRPFVRVCSTSSSSTWFPSPSEQGFDS